MRIEHYTQIPKDYTGVIEWRPGTPNNHSGNKEFYLLGIKPDLTWIIWQYYTNGKSDKVLFVTRDGIKEWCFKYEPIAYNEVKRLCPKQTAQIMAYILGNRFE